MTARRGEANLDAIIGQLIDDDVSISLAEMCRRCGVATDTILALVDEGVIEPSTASESTRMRLTFTAASVRRASTAVRLQNDLELNLSAVALVLELLDRIDALEAELRQQ